MRTVDVESDTIFEVAPLEQWCCRNLGVAFLHLQECCNLFIFGGESNVAYVCTCTYVTPTTLPSASGMKPICPAAEAQSPFIRLPAGPGSGVELTPMIDGCVAGTKFSMSPASFDM